MSEPIKSLHVAWCAATKQELNFRATERIFYDLWKLDITPEDVTCVVEFVLHWNKQHPDCPRKINLYSLCSDPSRFAADLAEAKPWKRNRVKPPTPREEILEAWRPTNGERVKPENAHKLSEFLRIPPTTNHQ